MKHFNGANVWGVLHEFTKKTTENGKAYIEVSVNCPNAKYGNVRVFGRLWGGDKAELFIKSFSPGQKVKLQGNLAQYKGKKDRTCTNFNFYAAEAWDPESDQHKTNRATFILVGEVTSFEDGKDEGRLLISVKREGAAEEVFEVFIPTQALLDFAYPVIGKLYRVKGVMAQEADEFGDVVKYSRPVVVEMEEKAADTPAPRPSTGSGRTDEGQGDIPF